MNFLLSLHLTAHGYKQSDLDIEAIADRDLVEIRIEADVIRYIMSNERII